MPAVRNQNERRARTRVTSLLSVTFLFSMGSWALGCCCQHSGCIFPARLTSTSRLHTPHPSATGVGVKAAEQLHQPARVSAGKGDIQGQQGQHASSELKFSRPAAWLPPASCCSTTKKGVVKDNGEFQFHHTRAHFGPEETLCAGDGMGISRESVRSDFLCPGDCMRSLGYSCLSRGWPTLLCSSGIGSS